VTDNHEIVVLLIGFDVWLSSGCFIQCPRSIGVPKGSCQYWGDDFSRYYSCIETLLCICNIV